MVKSLSYVGYAYYLLKDYNNSLNHLEKSLRMLERIHHNAAHPNIATSLLNIGVIYDKQEDYSRALDYYERALKIFQVFYKQNHSSIIWLEKRINEITQMFVNGVFDLFNFNH
jgi:tetratricopeptide (TPR) repeat protein